MNEYIDLVIPRGGDGLIKFVSENSTIPVIKHHKGICHTFVDASANLEKAVKICINAKCQRPGVCNAIETLLVHEKIAGDFLPNMAEEFKKNNVKIKGCDKTQKIIDVEPATEEDWSTEYLDLIISIKVVKNVDEAISFINKYGTGHSDAILTNNKKNADKFTAMVDSSSVYVNTSTRFTDGGEFGLGAEIGISTQKLHARGPMGANELTSYKFIVQGDGQIRE